MPGSQKPPELRLNPQQLLRRFPVPVLPRVEQFALLLLLRRLLPSLLPVFAQTVVRVRPVVVSAEEEKEMEREEKRCGYAVNMSVRIVFLGANSWMLHQFMDSGRATGIQFKYLKMNSSTVSIKDELVKIGKGRRPQKTFYARLLAKAALALA